MLVNYSSPNKQFSSLRIRKCLLGVIVVVFQMVFILGFDPAFETNDDAAMMLIASGFYSGDTSDALVFTNFVLGKVLCFLFERFPLYNWYLFYQYLILCSSILGLVLLFFEKKKNILIAFIPLILTAPFLLSLQYTSTAFVVGSLGWTIFWLKAKNGNTIWIFASLFCLLLCYWIRWHVYPILFGMSLPLMIYFHLLKKEKVYILFAGVVFFIFALHKRMDIWYYDLVYDHREIFEYQRAVDVVVNGPNNIQEDDLLKNNIPIEGQKLLSDFFWIDTDVFLVEKLVLLSKNKMAVRPFHEWLDHLVITLKSEWVYIFINLILVLPAVHNICLRGAPMAKMVVFLIFIETALFILCCLFFYRLPHRLFYPFLLSQTFLILSFGMNGEKITSYLMPIILTAFLVVFKVYKLNEFNKITKSELWDAISYFSDHPNLVFIIRGGSVPFEGFFSYKNPNVYSEKNIIPTGWVINTPSFEEILKIHSVRNPILSIEQENIRLVGISKEHINDYLCSRYGYYLTFQESSKTFQKNGQVQKIFKTAGRRSCMEKILQNK